MGKFKYKVMVVDDEPIILSGISVFLDWEKEDCILCGSARNGQEALDLIAKEKPNIVITDLKMPVMDGLTLLERAFDEFPSVVFIVLTSLEDLSLARAAIRYNVSDYILKTELDQNLLRATLNRAKQEYLKRVPVLDFDPAQNGEDSALKLLSNILIMREISPTTKIILERKGLLDNFAFLSFSFSYPVSSLEKNWKIDDYKRLNLWQKELVDKIVLPSFESVHPVQPTSGRNCRLVYFVSKTNPDTWSAQVNRIRERVVKSSQMVTAMPVDCYATDVYESKDDLLDARSEFENAAMCFYLGKDSAKAEILRYDDIFSIFEKAIREKDIILIKASFSRFVDELEKKDHSLEQIIFGLTALFSALNSAFSSMGISSSDSINEFRALIPYISKRDEVVRLVEDLQQETLSRISPEEGGNLICDRARLYVIEHVCEKISLSDVAEASFVSPGYLSRIFKRYVGINLVDYINKMKIEKAQSMMKNGQRRINELALSIGFDNVYYFSKVFKKISGVSPRDYLKNLPEL